MIKIYTQEKLRLGFMYQVTRTIFVGIGIYSFPLLNLHLMCSVVSPLCPLVRGIGLLLLLL